MNLVLNIIFIVLALSTSISLFVDLPFLFITGFILIFIDLLLIVIKNKNIIKSLKIILITFISIILLLIISWFTIVLIELNRFNNSEDPLLAKEITGERYFQEYEGLGYEIYSKSAFDPETKESYKLEAEFYLFGNMISAWIS